MKLGPGFGASVGVLATIFKNPLDILTDWDEITSNITINRSNRTLDISAIGVLHDQVFQYALDGWTGRYSMPLEFLLATHIATMTPDLSYKLATEFNTDVEILLWTSTNNSMDGGIQTSDGNVIDYERLSSMSGISGFVGERKTAAEVFKNNKDLHSLKSDSGAPQKYICQGAFDMQDVNGSNFLTLATESSGLDCDATFEAITNQTTAFTRLSTDQISKIINHMKNHQSWFTIEGVDCTNACANLVNNFLTSAPDFSGGVDVSAYQDVSATVYSDGKWKTSTSEGGATIYYYVTTFDLEEDNLVQANDDVTYQFRLHIMAVDYPYNAGETAPTPNDDLQVQFELVKYVCKNDGKTCSEVLQDSDLSNDPKQTCTACANYLKLLAKATKALHDTKFDSFIPYVNSVTNHWFRDVYFTKEAMKQEGVEDVISVDEEYYLSTGEMWTNYELDEEGDYELYVYVPDKDGNYTGEFANSGKLVCRETAGGSFGLSDKAANMYEKKANGGYGLYLVSESNETKTYTEYANSDKYTEFKVGKKAITEKKKKDWNAYELNPKGMSTGWIPYEGGVDGEDSNIEELQNLSKSAGIKLVYSLDYISGQINQVEDGVRGETNAETKKLFLDDYYLYDGTGARAKAIELAKETVRLENSDLDYNDPDSFRAIGRKDLNVSYNGQTQRVSIDDISGPINILQNSLTAFSILRNMHTLDSEYIYHDFKELMVELDYFDKEDLIESERSVMLFPIDGISSAGWPVTRYDKNEEFYGTLIHSAQDYETKRQETIEELAELFGEEVEDEEQEEAPAEPNPDAVTSDNLLVKAAADIMSYMQQNDYAYCQGAGYHPHTTDTGKVITIQEAHAGRSCYRASSFEDSQQPGHNLIDCSGFVSWCLQEVGIFKKGQLTSSGNIDSVTTLANYYTSGRKASYSEYNPGTILIYSGHVSIYAGNGVFYDAGSTNCMKKSPLDISGWHPASSVQGYIEIPNDKMTYNGVTGIGGSVTMAKFDGYEGGEAVLAPVTGEVIKYGTITRKNVETDQDEEVGFIKIRVLGNQEAVPGSTCKYFGDEDNKKGYNYFWEEYIEAGITNHVLYIEGFDVSNILSTVDKDASVKGGNIKELKTYIAGHDDENNYSTKYQVPRLVDEKKMERLEKQEEAKKDAVYTIEQDDKIYVKEGAVIGHTYTQDKVNMVDGVGNYMRVIFRDVDDQVVENVENYMEIDEATVGTGVYAEGSEIEFMAGVLTAECGGASEEGMTAASWVIRNRVESGRFGDSLAEVLVAKNQFEVVSTSPTGIKGYNTGDVISIDVNGTTYYVTAPTDKALEIAQKVMNGQLANPIADRLFWKSASTNVDQSKDPIQIPAGTGNKYHY